MAAGDVPPYVCTLTAASEQKAREELNEDPRQRLSHVETLRQWILERPHLRVQTDTEFLLRFLRHAKFSQLRAREVLHGYLTLKTDIPEWFTNFDPCDPEVEKVLRTGFYMVLPKRDKEGRTIVLLQSGSFKPDKSMNKDVMVKTMFCMFHYVAADENTMVNGLVNLMDFTGFGMKHQTFWGIESMKKMTKCWQNKLPARMKAFHYYNVSTVVETIMNIVKPLMSKKFQQRMYIHGQNMEAVYAHVPMECLPREYLPDDYTGPHAGSTQQILENFIRDLQSPDTRKRLMAETSPQWGCDQSQQRRADQGTPGASFRQLSTD